MPVPLAVLVISPRLYRWHRLYPEHLPLVLRRASRLVLGQDLAWFVMEGQGYELTNPLDADYQLPVEWPMTTNMMLQGVVYGAVVSLVQRVEEGGGVP